MEEDGWFEQPIYIVWLHGCTDGWPQAIFRSRTAAQDWVNECVHLNPEGYDIIEMDFKKLCYQVVEREGV
jgi:hypothetical protein